MENTEFDAELLPGLPHDLGLECLTRLHYSAYPLASRVCGHWCHLLRSDDFYHHRKKSGHTRKLACMVQAIPLSSEEVTDGGKSTTASPSYGITVFDPVSQSWDRLEPVSDYPFGLPLFCQLASCEGKLILMGGWDPVSYEPVTELFIYDFRTSQWRRGKDMPSMRSFFAIGSWQDRVYVAGGHDENKNALKTAWVYDPKRDEWSELTQMSQERDECQGLVVNDEFWVVGGYTTEAQGAFDGSVDVYGFESGQWRRVEGAWEAGRCPRSCVGISDGKLVRWDEMESGVRVGVCGVKLGKWTLVSGSEYQGAPNGFYLMEGQNCKLKRMTVANNFSGFVQSGCCVEI